MKKERYFLVGFKGVDDRHRAVITNAYVITEDGTRPKKEDVFYAILEQENCAPDFITILSISEMESQEELEDFLG
jgi:hypothetical protein